MTSSIEIAAQRRGRKQRTRRIAFAAIAVISLSAGITVAAPEPPNEKVYKALPAYYLNDSTVRAGCVGRLAAITAPGDGSGGAIALILTPATGSCTQPTQNRISGTSTIMLVKNGEICRSEEVSTDGWKQGFSWSKTYRGSPCGRGYYSVIACSQSISYERYVDGGTFIAKTLEDCSHYGTWSYSSAVYW